MVPLTLSFFLCTGVFGRPAQMKFSFYSGEYGGSNGHYFDQSSNQLDGPITALKIGANDRYIFSIQVRYGDSWSNTEGSEVGSPSSTELFLGEGLVQVTGRFGSYVEYLAFRTNLGRLVAFGPSAGSGMTFDAEPLFPNSVLRYVSGRSGSLVNALGFHWDQDQFLEMGNQSSFSTHPPEITPT
ncbi:hypothetical protein JRQ81_006019 [Phrynocephalus forsythii]|uniref:Jacalin-type lectin domain-containing protein n=1 Tax=Phrynocephalus forsythii TaxID=171643 RepID=A0A9Q1AVH9_9SAUR|nr:hypothetical protein JRQ81_006019 [Phrynocephalus forsythii]